MFLGSLGSLTSPSRPRGHSPLPVAPGVTHLSNKSPTGVTHLSHNVSRSPPGSLTSLTMFPGRPRVTHLSHNVSGSPLGSLTSLTMFPGRPWGHSPLSQCFPVAPGSQSHRYPFLMSIQSPTPLHGEDRHSSTAETYHTNKLDILG